MILLQKKSWQGSGKIDLEVSPEQLNFTTTWTIEQVSDTKFLATSIVIINETKDKLKNSMTFVLTGSDSFIITLKNEFLPLVEGIGSFDDKECVWSFNCPEVLEGKEKFMLAAPEQLNFNSEFGNQGYKNYISGTLFAKG